MTETTHEALSRWAEFYLITGGAAAALTGLQFVVQTLIASGLRPQTSESPEAGIAAFGSPTVVHFSLALVYSALFCVPWAHDMSLRLAVGSIAAGALIYSLIVLRRTKRQESYEPAVEDWIWHVFLPFAAYSALIVGSILLRIDQQWPLFGFAGATLLLVCIGIHNAWDTVTYLTVAAWRNDENKRKPDNDVTPDLLDA